MFKHIATLGVLLFCAFSIWGEPLETFGSAEASGASLSPVVALAPRPAAPEPETIEVARAAPPPESFGAAPRLVGEPVLISLIDPVEADVADNNVPLDQPAAASATLDDAIVRPQFRVTGSRVNVRAGPSTGNAVIGSVARGDILEEMGPQQRGWIEIRNIETGLVGFMSARFVEEM